MTRKIYKISVAGPDYHQKALASLMTEANPDYKLTKTEMLDEYDLEERIYQYETSECELQIWHEPGNQYDPAALQVFADGVFIGYVPRDNLQVLSSLARMPRLEMHVEIYGGKFRYLEHDEENDPFLEMKSKHFKIRTDSSPYRAIMVFKYDG